MRSSPDDIDLGSLGRAIKKSLPRTALYALLAGGLTAAVMMTMAPQYVSQATIEILARQVLDPNNPNTSTTSTPSARALTKEELGTHVINIQSTDLTRQMSEQLHLKERPEFNARLEPDDTFTGLMRMLGIGKAKDSETDDDRVLASYRTAMKVANKRDTNAISIEFTTPNPDFSAKGANLLADLYRDSLASSRKVEISDTEKKLAAQVDRLEKELRIADKAVTDFRAKVDIFKTQGAQGTTTQNDDRLGQLTAELSKAAAARTDAEARATAAKEQMRLGTADSNPDVQKSQMIPRLVESRIRQERQVSELATALLPGHPRMRQVQGDLASLQRQIKDEVKKVVDGLEKDAKIAADKESSLAKQVAGIKVTIKDQSPADAQLKALEDETKGKRSELERVKKDYEAIRTRGGTGQAVEVRLVQEAKSSNEKVAPKPGMFAPLVALATVLVGLAWSVTKAIVTGPPAAGGGGTEGRGSRGNLEQVSIPAAAALVAAPAAALAMSRAGSAKAQLVGRPDPVDLDSSRLDAAVAALLQREAAGACRSLIAADRADFDAAGEALGLAKALASAGKSVVLVDWSSTASSLADRTGGAPQPGLAQLIQGDAAFEDVIQKLADTEAHFVPSGDVLVDQSVIFDADRANLVLDAMDEAFEHVVVFADHASARDLFEATQGRFDTGLIVTDISADPSDTAIFLGFDVADMALHRIVRTPIVTASASATPAMRRGPARSAARPGDTQARA